MPQHRAGLVSERGQSCCWEERGPRGRSSVGHFIPIHRVCTLYPHLFITRCFFGTVCLHALRCNLIGRKQHRAFGFILKPRRDVAPSPPNAAGGSCLLFLAARQQVESHCKTCRPAVPSWLLWGCGLSQCNSHLPPFVPALVILRSGFSTRSGSTAFSTFYRAGTRSCLTLHTAISVTGDESIFMDHSEESLFFNKTTKRNQPNGFETG